MIKGKKMTNTDTANVATANANAATNAATNAAAEATTPENTVIETKIAELTNDLQRTRADFENYRKQMDVQKSQAVSYAKLETVKKILPILDDISRAIAATPDLKPLEKTLEKTLKELKLTKIEADPDTPFNPDLHDAVMMNDTGGDQEVIEEVLRDGYFYDGEILRPAMVKVTTK